LLAALADPLGINALKAMTKDWTAVERNVRTIGFPAVLLVNRVLWLAIAGGVLGLLLRTFRFTERFGLGRGDVASDEVPRVLGGAAPKVAGVFGRRTRILQTLAVMREALTDIASGWPFRVAFVAAIALVPLLGWNVGAHYIDTVTWPVTHLVASVVIADDAVFIPWVIIVLFAGELVWKD